VATVRKIKPGTYQVRWRAPDGKQSGKTFRLKRDAKRYKQEIEAQLAGGVYVDPSRGRKSVSEVAALWVKDPSWEETTRERNESILRTYVVPKWGRYQLRHVTHDSAQEWVHDLCAQPRANGTTPLSARSVRKVVGVLNNVLDHAVKSGRLGSNPAEGLRLPRVTASHRRYLNAREVERLATGMRFSEIAGLKAKYVDLERKRVRVEEVVVELDDGSLHWKGPKDYERRSIALTDFLVELLVARLNSRSPDDLVFPSAEGAVMRNSNFRRNGFDAAVEAAAVSPLTPHELRHTAASMAISAGANVLAVQRMLGHEKASTTLNTYSDLFDTDLEDVASALGRMRNGALVDEKWMDGSTSADVASNEESPQVI